MEENLVLKEGKVYIPKNKELRVNIIQLHHNILVAEHRGRYITILALELRLHLGKDLKRSKGFL